MTCTRVVTFLQLESARYPGEFVRAIINGLRREFYPAQELSTEIRCCPWIHGLSITMTM